MGEYASRVSSVVTQNLANDWFRYMLEHE